ncbi:alternate-type signal peptide domain-containing protein [Nocardioides coralli]|uniref:alternate-type signal peptide domain-containing protein n=1 Tax=Nocardioides coralli TaxID=2872154 RepID=UPI001CA39083|nr:alternate-type signal peptide domain-containing protein [Nocardioides coralli]QZY29828.1 alternate-type signal peptide domain-containing protein [Nocardioides coralli]
MNKMMKGSIAGATGIALLMGGFGTYALWSDSEDLAQNGVTSGELTVDTTGGVWDDLGTPGVAGDWSAADKLVPGDQVSYTQTFTVSATGKNLQGTIALATGALSSGFGGGNLTRAVDVNVTTPGTATITKDSPTSFSFTSPFDTATLTAVVTYTFNDVDNLTDQNASASTPASAFTISQTS